MKALLIIDMQKGSFTPATPRYDSEGVIRRINELATACRQHQIPVIWIQHDGSGTGAFEKHAQDWELLDELNPLPTDLFIDKVANDVFYRSKLQATLSDLEVNELFITGCATDFCVESTVQSALTKDYQIVVVEDGHTTGERPHLQAKQVIAHYNWVWQDMLPTQGGIQVRPTIDILSDLNQEAKANIS